MTTDDTHSIEALGQMTLADLSRLGRTIGDILAFALAPDVAPAARPSTRARLSRPVNNGRRQRSTPEELEGLRSTVLAQLRRRGDWTRAETIKKVLDVEPERLRAALAHLVSQDVIERQGQARATRYRILKGKR